MTDTEQNTARKRQTAVACAAPPLAQLSIIGGVLPNFGLWALLLFGAWIFLVKGDAQPGGFTGLQIAFLLGWGAFAFALAGRRGNAAWPAWPVALAGLLAVLYVEATSPSVRQHDVDGHCEYIEHIILKRNLPPVQQGWETWQPPLYYVAAALWRWPFNATALEDAFRPVQFMAATLYLAALIAALLVMLRLDFSNLETAGALGLLAFLPGHLFFAGRINNDVLLPVLGGGLLWSTSEFVRTGVRCWVWGVAVLCTALLATKGSSLAIVGGVLGLVLWSEARRSGWRAGLWQAYVAAAPAAVWQIFWCGRTALQTGNPLYVNAALPDHLRIDTPGLRRLFSFDLPAFIEGGFYYDEAVRQSYPTAIATSLLYGEYGMHDLMFRLPEFLRWGCLGVLLVIATGALVAPRNELRPVWITCLVLAGCQTLITVVYAIQFPYSCNQNMRFFAQAFVPVACLFGLGLGQFWLRAGIVGKAAVATILTVFLLGLADFYNCLLLQHAHRPKAAARTENVPNQILFVRKSIQKVCKKL